MDVIPTTHRASKSSLHDCPITPPRASGSAKQMNPTVQQFSPARDAQLQVLEQHINDTISKLSPQKLLPPTFAESDKLPALLLPAQLQQDLCRLSPAPRRNSAFCELSEMEYDSDRPCCPGHMFDRSGSEILDESMPATPLMLTTQQEQQQMTPVQQPQQMTPVQQLQQTTPMQQLQQTTPVQQLQQTTPVQHSSTIRFTEYQFTPSPVANDLRSFHLQTASRELPTTADEELSITLERSVLDEVPMVPHVELQFSPNTMNKREICTQLESQIDHLEALRRRAVSRQLAQQEATRGTAPPKRSRTPSQTKQQADGSAKTYWPMFVHDIAPVYKQQQGKY